MVVGRPSLRHQLPVPVFDYVQASRTKEWIERLETTLRLLRHVRPVVDHEVKGFFELVPDDLVEPPGVFLIDTPIRLQPVREAVGLDVGSEILAVLALDAIDGNDL